MARRVTPSQLKTMLRQQENKRRQAINKYNQAINNYNRAAKAHNDRVRRNRQELKNLLDRLSRISTSRATHVVYRTSTITLDAAYERMQQHYRMGDENPNHSFLLDLAAQENENSIAAANAVISGEFDDEDEFDSIQETELKDELSAISADLNDRWDGALYSLNPRNPDAARHFCTSAREIIIKILDFGAPDGEVLRNNPNCAKTELGTPIRREKVRYLVNKKGLSDSSFEDFVDQDIDNVVTLFRVFNDGTHGVSGTFDLPTLFHVKRRVEGAIQFLTALMR